MTGKQNKDKNMATIRSKGVYPTSTSTISLTGGGTSSTVLTSNGSGANWTNAASQVNNVMSIPYGDNKVIIDNQAELEVRGRIKLNGECLNERLTRIENLLNIPTRNIEMETKYSKLKELWEAYNRELSKYITWDKLKESK